MKNQVYCCAFTISIKFKDPANKNTLNKQVLIAISYEIIWAADLQAPKNAYLELLAHPEIITPQTFNEDNASKIKLLQESSIKTEVILNGTKPHENKDKNKDIIGAEKNKNLFDFVGIIISLVKSFNASANGCKNP